MLDEVRRESAPPMWVLHLAIIVALVGMVPIVSYVFVETQYAVRPAPHDSRLVLPASALAAHLKDPFTCDNDDQVVVERSVVGRRVISYRATCRGYTSSNRTFELYSMTVIELSSGLASATFERLKDPYPVATAMHSTTSQRRVGLTPLVGRTFPDWGDRSAVYELFAGPGHLEGAIVIVQAGRAVTRFALAGIPLDPRGVVTRIVPPIVDELAER